VPRVGKFRVFDRRLGLLQIGDEPPRSVHVDTFIACSVEDFQWDTTHLPHQVCILVGAIAGARHVVPRAAWGKMTISGNRDRFSRISSARKCAVCLMPSSPCAPLPWRSTRTGQARAGVYSAGT